MKSSQRWITSIQKDVDAYLLRDGSWALFAILKDEALAQKKDAAFMELARQFSYGTVNVVAGALKTRSASEPLSPLFIAEKKSENVEAVEHHELRDLVFRLEVESVLNPGLFLDQKENREILMHLCANNKGGKMLNLFSYTGAFSVGACVAGADSSVSVDLSSRYLRWEKDNFALNGIEESRHRLIKEDARVFLKRAARRADKYRWIVIDPPTFSRADGKKFEVRTALLELVDLAAVCLERGGAILASCNDARWDSHVFEAEMSDLALDLNLNSEFRENAVEYLNDYALKSCWLTSMKS